MYDEKKLAEIFACWGPMVHEPHSLYDYETEEEFVERYKRMYIQPERER